MNTKKFTTILLAIFLSITAFSFKEIEKDSSYSTQESELLYFPEIKYLKLISFGYENVLSNVLWFQTVNYFGKHYRSDQDYTWLNHMCNAVSELDKKHKEIYEFCALLIAWEQNEVKEAQKILKKGIVATNYWRFHYLHGMNNLMFLNNPEGAKQDFITASNITDSPSFVKRLASKQVASLDSPEASISFLADMVKNSKDKTQKEALTKHLYQTINSYNIYKLEEYLEKYNDKFLKPTTNIKDLKKVGAPDNIYNDPFKGKYFIDKDGKIASTNKERKISLFNKEKNNAK